MNILFLTIAWPKHDYNLYTDLMEEFVKDGHQVYVAAANERRHNTNTYLTTLNGIQVLHIKCENLTKVNKMEKAVGLLTIDYRFRQAIKKYWHDIHIDLIIMSTPPVNLLGTYSAMKRKYKAKTYLLLKDIWPQGPADFGAIKVNGFIYKYFRRIEKRLYDTSDFIGCMSRKNVEYLLAHNKNIDPAKVEVNPNSIKPRYVEQSIKERREIRKKYGVPTDKVVFVYGGNLGEPQGVEFLEACIRSNESRNDTYFLVIGSGTKYPRIKDFFTQLQPQNAALLSVLPKNEYETLCRACDVGLIYLSSKCTIPHFPSRLLSYMQNEMPVLLAVGEHTDVGEIVQSNEFGYFCTWGDINSFDQKVEQLAADAEMRQIMGSNAKKYLEEHFTASLSYATIMRRM